MSATLSGTSASDPRSDDTELLGKERIIRGASWLGGGYPTKEWRVTRRIERDGTLNLEWTSTAWGGFRPVLDA